MKYMSPIALMDKFPLNINTDTAVSHMNRHSCKPNKLKNVNPVSGRVRNSTIQKKKKKKKNRKFILKFSKSKSSRLI